MKYRLEPLPECKPIMSDYLKNFLAGFVFEAREIKNVLFIFMPEDVTKEEALYFQKAHEEHLKNHFEKTVVVCGGLSPNSIRIAEAVDIDG